MKSYYAPETSETQMHFGELQDKPDTKPLRAVVQRSAFKPSSSVENTTSAQQSAKGQGACRVRVELDCGHVNNKASKRTGSARPGYGKLSS